MDTDKPVIMPRKEIPFGHWGIVTEEAFAAMVAKDGFELAVSKIFQKRWDPITSNYIDLSRGTDTHLPDKFAGEYTLVSALRDQRPAEQKGIVEVVKSVSPSDTKKEPPKVFPDIIGGKDYCIVVSKDDRRAHDPFSDQPRLEALHDCAAATIINRFPSYGRIIDEVVFRQVRKLIETPLTKISKGINLVTLPTQYYEKIEDMPLDTIATMFASQAVAMQNIERHANRDGIRYMPVDLFFNIGYKVGGSLKWVHSQTFVDLNQDGHGRTMEEILQSFDFQQKHGGCYFCGITRENMRDFFLYENDAVALYVNPSPQTNFETIFYLKSHVPDLLYASKEQFNALADVLVRDFRALNAISAVDVDRNILIYQRPFGYNSYFHTFGKVVPYEIKGGKERIDNARVAQYNPKNVADYLRKTGAF